MHADNQLSVVMLNRLTNAVAIPPHHVQPLARLVDRLMMQTADAQSSAPKDLTDKGIRVEKNLLGW